MKRLVIIDGHAILHRAYHALPPLATSKGQLVNAVYGFISMLLRVINDVKPTHLIVAFDTPAPTFRNRVFKDYQKQRPKLDKELVSQIEIVHKLIHEMGIPVFEKDGYEADDVIGTLAIKASGQRLKTKNSKKETIISNSKNKDEIETVIVTGDRDILQLVTDKIKVYMPIKGLSKSKIYDEREVEEKFGVKPCQIADYKALVGDASDNYPGISGIGPKTAKDLLAKYQSFDGVYSHLNELKSEKIRKRLIEGKKEGEMSKKLATILTNVPIELDLEKCVLSPLDKPQVYWALEELEFRSLISRLSADNRQQIANNKKTKNIEKTKDNPSQIKLF